MSVFVHLSLSLCVSLCFSVSLRVSLSVSLCVFCRSLCPSVSHCLSLCPSVSLRLPMCPCLSLFQTSPSINEALVFLLRGGLESIGVGHSQPSNTCTHKPSILSVSFS